MSCRPVKQISRITWSVSELETYFAFSTVGFRTNVNRILENCENSSMTVVATKLTTYILFIYMPVEGYVSFDSKNLSMVLLLYHVT